MGRIIRLGGGAGGGAGEGRLEGASGRGPSGVGHPTEPDLQDVLDCPRSQDAARGTCINGNDVCLSACLLADAGNSAGSSVRTGTRNKNWNTQGQYGNYRDSGVIENIQETQEQSRFGRISL